MEPTAAEASPEPAADADALAAVERAVDEAARVAAEAAERAAAADDDAPMPPEAEPAPSPEEPESHPTEDLLPEPLDLIARLSRAESRDDVAEAVLDAALEYVDRAVLVISQKDRVLGWAAKPVAENFRTFVLPYTEASVFATLKDSDSFYVGPPADLPGNRKIFRALGTKKKPTISVVPVTLKGKSVLFLFCETDADKPVPQIPPLRRLAAMTAVGLEIVLLKNRLRNL